MNDPQLSAVFNRLDEFGEDMYSLGIKACRYKDHWPDTFGEVLREEGLFALNALAAAFPPMEDYDKFCAVVEYADANTSKAYIALAEHLDEFEFFPGIRDEVLPILIVFVPDTDSDAVRGLDAEQFRNNVIIFSHESTPLSLSLLS